jgi:hypothetical protein
MNREQMAQDFVDRKLQPGERAHFFNVNGQMMNPAMGAMLHSMWQAQWENQSLPMSPTPGAPGKYQKPVWDLFRMTLRPGDDNDHDPYALSVDVLMLQPDKTWRSHQIGWIPATDQGTHLGHNRTLRAWSVGNRIRLVSYPVSKGSAEVVKLPAIYVVDIGWEGKVGNERGWLMVAVVTDGACDAPAKGSAPTYSISKDLPEAKAPAHQGAAPGLSVTDLPSPQEIAKLIDLQREFELCFGWEEMYSGEKFTLKPVVLSGWAPDSVKVRKFATEEEFTKFETTNRCYGDVEGLVDLRAIEKEHGPIMASRYYKISGPMSGPFSAIYVREIIRVMEAMLTPVRAFLVATGRR